MSVSVLDIVYALTVIAQAGLTAQQVDELLQKDGLTEADVQAQLDRTDSAIQRALNDN